MDRPKSSHYDALQRIESYISRVMREIRVGIYFFSPRSVTHL